MSRSDEDLKRVKAHLEALSKSLPSLIERVRGLAGGRDQAPMPDAEAERHRLAAFAAYLDHYSRIDGQTRGPIDVRAVLEEAVALAGGEITPKARVGASYLPVPLVYANPRQLGQVFVSLLINAAQALPAGNPDANRIDVTLDTNDAGWARVTLTDTGSGIAPDVLPHIFEPLYSTKRGAGMGVGLAIVREIIQGLGGRISVDSELGRGTTFVIELPAVS